MLNIGKIIGKFVKNTSQRELGRLSSIVEEINGFERKVKNIADEEFPAKTVEFRSKIKNGMKMDAKCI